MEKMGMYALEPRFRSDIVRDLKRSELQRKEPPLSILLMSKKELEHYVSCEKNKDILKKKIINNETTE